MKDFLKVLGGNLFNFGLNSYFTNSMMKRQYDYGKKLFDYTSNYNSPVNQVARLKEAGINPALALSTITGNNGSLSMPSGSGAPQKTNNDFVDAMAMKQMREQTRSMYLDNENKEIDLKYKKYALKYPSKESGFNYGSDIGNETDGYNWYSYAYWSDMVGRGESSVYNARKDEYDKDSAKSRSTFDYFYYDLKVNEINKMSELGLYQDYEKTLRLKNDNAKFDTELSILKKQLDILNVDEEYKKKVNNLYYWDKGSEIISRCIQLIFDGVSKFVPTGKILDKVSDLLSLFDNGKKHGKIN